eukprot:scaffold4047_cov188-Prasinococcus_capsulatus_cf.AAC.1
MAAAIAVHNIPEGVIVAAPVFAATGSRWKSLALALASGLSEPLGAQLPGGTNAPAAAVVPPSYSRATLGQ